MAIQRQYEPLSVKAEDLRAGRIDPYYFKVLTRLLAAHAIAEKLTALGYQRALGTIEDPALRKVLEKNLREESKHARLVYRLLRELGISESQADRQMGAVLKTPSFEAPSCFAARVADELELVMASLSVDLSGLIMIGVNYRESSYYPHARAAELIVDEEAEHDRFSCDELGAVLERFGASKVNEALAQWVPRAANFFGPPGSGFSYDCIRYGLKSRDNQELAELYLEMLGRRLARLGLVMPRLSSAYPRQIA